MRAGHALRHRRATPDVESPDMPRQRDVSSDIENQSMPLNKFSEPLSFIYLGPSVIDDFPIQRYSSRHLNGRALDFALRAVNCSMELRYRQKDISRKACSEYPRRDDKV